jgi:hypothetical protein
VKKKEKEEVYNEDLKMFNFFPNLILPQISLAETKPKMA